jgi:hypothetical protein
MRRQWGEDAEVRVGLLWDVAVVAQDRRARYGKHRGSTALGRGSRNNRQVASSSSQLTKELFGQLIGQRGVSLG